MLTARQEEILDYIRSYQREHSIPPSTRMIKKHFGFASQNSAQTHLRALAAKNAVVQLADGSWGVKASEIQGMLELPLYGSIPAGFADTREQVGGEVVSFDPSLFGVRAARQGKLWALRVTGDSMINAHICDGDIGVFERREAKPGDIIAALVDGTQTTLKRLVRATGGRLVLRAENPRYADIVPSEGLESQGVLIGLIRRMATT